MAENLKREIATVEFDGLVNAAYPNESVGITLLKNQGVLKRGTVIALDDNNKGIVLGTDLTAGYLEATSSTPGALKVVASNPSEGQIAVASVTPVVDSDYTPAANDYVVYQEAKHFEPKYILHKDIDTDGAADVVGIAYAEGHFIKQKLIVKTGYTITAADIDSLRIHNISLADTL